MDKTKFTFKNVVHVFIIVFFLIFLFLAGFIAFTLISGGGPPIIGQLTNMAISPFAPILIVTIPTVTVILIKLIPHRYHKFTNSFIIIGLFLTGIFSLPFLFTPLTYSEADEQFSAVFGNEWNRFGEDISQSFYSSPNMLINSYLGFQGPEKGMYETDFDNVFVENDDYTLRYNVYYPGKNAAKHIGQYSTVIFVHGGGWMMGDRKIGADRLRHFASQGYVCFSFDYRLLDVDTATVFTSESGIDFSFLPEINGVPEDLAGDYTLKDLMVDMANFTQFLSKNEGGNSLHGADLDSVYIIGQSAGSHLAGLMGFGYNNDLEDDVWGFSANLTIKGIVLFYPPNNARDFFYNDHRFYYDNEFTDGKSPEDDAAYFDLYTPSEFVDKGDPICLIFHGTSDSMVPIKNSYEIRQEYEENENDLILLKSLFVGHAYDAGTWYRTLSDYYIERFLYLCNKE